MKILYIGDIMAKPGIETVRQLLPKVAAEHSPDVVIAQAENVSNGKSMTLTDMDALRSLGVHFFTGGNHTPANKELHDALIDRNQPVIGPANMPACPGPGYKSIETKHGNVLIVSLLGSTVGKAVLIDNPLHAVDKILKETAHVEYAAKVLNFHGDFSSEKRIIGYYLDGKVSLVVGDHWHVPTSDAMVLPQGTAHITDVGMCGSLHSSLGVTLGSVVPRWRDGKVTRNKLSEEKPYQFNAVIADIDEQTGLARSIKQVQETIT